MTTFILKRVRKHIVIGLSLVFSVFFMSNVAISQTLYAKPKTTMFRGTIVDALNARIPQASVLIEGGGKKWELQSDEEGEFKVNLPFGEYKFTIEKDHFKQLIVINHCITKQAKIEHKFEMEIGECSDCSEWFEPDEDNPPAKQQPYEMVERVQAK